jgi:enterochelin esterase family protein
MHPLLERARKKSHPLIKGNTATFLWEGKDAPRLIDDSHEWEENPVALEKVEPGLWSVTLTLPRDAYLEYGFMDPETEERLDDPLNPDRTLWNGLGAYNHFFYMPKGGPTPLTQVEPGVPRGKVTRHKVETDSMAVGEERTVYLYQPPVKRPVPLVVVYDGPDYLRRGKLAPIVDNLISHKRIRPVAMALVQNGGQARGIEYACSEMTLGFIAKSVVDLAREHLNLIDINQKLGAYGIMGASMGGLMALYTGLRLPGIFGKVLSQSGAFSFPEHEFITSDVVRHMPKPKLDIWMDVGALEGLLDCNRQMAALLKEKDYRVTYREYPGGHNYTAWRDDLWRGLEALFGK